MLRLQLWAGIKITGLAVKKPPKTLSRRDSLIFLCLNYRLSPPNFPKIAVGVYVGNEGTSYNSTCLYTEIPVIISVQLIAKQKMVNSFFNVLVVSFICGAIFS